MSPNKRIFLNIVATYGRSLYALFCGLITARWVFQTLGVVDYGLMGLIGGLTAFISFINSIMAVSVGRYFSYAIGRAQIPGNEQAGLEEGRQWFNTAVVLHTVVPLILMIVGYPIGEWAIRHFLVIPNDRINDCLWIFRLACVGCLWGMMAVPYNAMYGAHQYIAELTIYSFVTTTLNVLFLCYMIRHPGYWLLRLAIWNFVLGFIPQVIITIRAYKIFPECRFNYKYMRSITHLKQLGSFAGWYAFGMFGNLCRYQCLPILVNKYFGPSQNAAMAIANNAAGHTEMLSGSLIGAFQPALVNALGAGDMKKATAYMYRICKYGTVLMLLFCIPLGIEIDNVMRLWLIDPPQASPFLAIGVIVSLILERLTTGHWIMISGNGKIALYQFLVGINFVITLPLCWFLIQLDFGVYSVVYSSCATLVSAIFIRLVMVRHYMAVGPRYWFKRVFLPIVSTVIVVVLIGMLPRFWFSESLLRVVITTAITEIVLLPLVFFWILDADERVVIFGRVLQLAKRMGLKRSNDE